MQARDKISPLRCKIAVKFYATNSRKCKISPPGYWDNKENIEKIFLKIKEKYNFNTPEDWNSITATQIKSIGGSQLLQKYLIYELKCMACPEGKSIFNATKRSSGYWDCEENILQFLSDIKKIYNLNSAEDWNSITREHVLSNGGSRLLSKYSMFELKCMACPEGKSIFKRPTQPSGYWKNKENVLKFLSEIKEKYNFNTPEDWNSLTQKQIKSNGGSRLLSKYSMFEIKCIACPEGKSIFKSPQPPGYWENTVNIEKFLSKIKEKYNLNTPEDWNSMTNKHILSNGGSSLLHKYSIFELKCMACPEGKSAFERSTQPSGYWKNKENILQFLSEIKEKYNLNTSEDWNSITSKQIQSNGGGSLLDKYSMFEIKCMACPEGKSIFNSKHPPGYWENTENILKFLSEVKEKYNLNTPEDWNSITQKQIIGNEGGSLLSKYSMFELKCMACPEGKSIFSSKLPSGYWGNTENILQFLSQIKEKYNLNTPNDWNALSQKQITSNGGSRLLSKYSMFELKCMACPEGKSIFTNSKHPTGYWENKENILQFLSQIKGKYNVNTPEDWNLITSKHIKSNGGGILASKYSMYDIRCLACPEGKSIFNNPPNPSGYWENKENIDSFISIVKQKYNLNSPEDWKRIAKRQITSEGGWGLFNSKCYSKIKIKFETPKEEPKFVPLSQLISESPNKGKRSSQRWLFLQVLKLFPGEEIVEDYFHSEISRISGANIQFDIFMIERKIAIEYHGEQHYQDIPHVFGNLETYQYRDLEKEKLCKEHEIQLIVVPYWWDNKLDSLETFLHSKINL